MGEIDKVGQIDKYLKSKMVTGRLKLTKLIGKIDNIDNIDKRQNPQP